MSSERSVGDDILSALSDMHWNRDIGTYAPPEGSDPATTRTFPLIMTPVMKATEVELLVFWAEKSSDMALEMEKARNRCSSAWRWGRKCRGVSISWGGADLR